jgi:DNA-binding NtrC family response regulator
MVDQTESPRTKRILIVEDDPVHRRLLEEELRQKYDLEFAADSKSALQLIDRSLSDYHLVIVDLRIPPQTGALPSADEGFKILQTIQKSHSRLPIVLVTSGSLIDRLSKQVMTLGVKKIFEKPFFLDEFRDFIDSLLSTSSRQRQEDVNVAEFSR